MSLPRQPLLWLLVTCSFLVGFVGAQIESSDHRYEFEQFTWKEGLSANRTTFVHQDDVGYLWIGSVDGINRFDGHSFKKYYVDQHDPSSPEFNSFKLVVEDERDRLWFAPHREGQGMFLNCFDHNSGIFSRLGDYDERITSYGSMEKIQSLIIARDGTWWAGDSEGTYRLDRDSTSWEKYWPLNKNDLSGAVRQIYEDSNGWIWMASIKKGMVAVDPNSGESYSFFDLTDNSLSRTENVSFGMTEDSDRFVWATFFTRGAVRFDLKNKLWETYPLYFPETGELSMEYDARAIFVDSEDQIWLGSSFDGIFLFNPEQKRFEPFPIHLDTAVSDRIEGRDIIQDQQGAVWITTRENGVIRVSPRKEGLRSLSAKHEDGSLISEIHTNSAIVDSKNRIWIGSLGNGIYVFDASYQLIRHFKHDSENSESLASDRIWQMIEARDGSFWVAMRDGISRISSDLSDIQTIHLLDPQTSGFQDLSFHVIYQDSRDRILAASNTKVFAIDPHSLEATNLTETFTEATTNRINCIFERGKGEFWLGTTTGLHVYDLIADKYTKYQVDPQNPYSINSDNIYYISEDRKRQLYVCTSRGFNIFDPINNRFEGYDARDGLSGNLVKRIIEDQFGQIWVMTENNLTRFLPDSGEFESIDVVKTLLSDGLNDIVKLKDGQFLLAAANGLYSYRPEKYGLTEGNQLVPKFAITEFSKFNKPIPIDEIPEEEGIYQFTHKDEIIGFKLALFDFQDRERNRYYYMLEGLDDDWVYNEHQHAVTYTNLKAGHYTFRAKGLNWNGVASEEAVFRFYKAPPLWVTWWFRSLCIAMLLIVAVLIHTYVTRNIRRSNAILKDTVDQLNHEVGIREKAEKAMRIAKEEAEVASEAKSRFLANMSHEIRTPLNAIMGMSQLIVMESASEERQDQANTILSTSSHLLDVLSDVLDLARIETKHDRLLERDFDIILLAEDVIKMVSGNASEKGLGLILDVAPNVPSIYSGDVERIRQVLVNLMSNAVKYTDQGEVILQLRLGKRDEQGSVFFNVIDTGIGIPDELHERIFNAFEQADDSNTRSYEGTGLGLAIAKRIVDTMGGEIRLSSSVGSGSTFSVVLELDSPSDPLSSNKDFELDMKGVHAWIFDDNPIRSKNLQGWLESWNAIVSKKKRPTRKDFNFKLDRRDAPRIAFVDVDNYSINKELMVEASECCWIALAGPGKTDLSKIREEGGFDFVIRQPLTVYELLRRTKASVVHLQEIGMSLKSDPNDTVVPVEIATQGNLLLVEDNLNNQNVLKQILSKLGYQVTCIDNGEAVLPTLKSANYDLVLMDLHMPKASGYEATSWIRNSHSDHIDKDIPIVAVTAKVLKGERERCLASGMNDYIPKPVSVKLLQQVLRKHIH